MIYLSLTTTIQRQRSEHGLLTGLETFTVSLASVNPSTNAYEQSLSVVETVLDVLSREPSISAVVHVSMEKEA